MAKAMPDPRYKHIRFTQGQLDGKQHVKLTADLNEIFLTECDRTRRKPADMLRIILEDHYKAITILAKDVKIEPHNKNGASEKRDVA